MNLGTLFRWSGTNQSTEIPEIFPMPISNQDFVSIDVESIYQKILVDTIERTQGISDEQLKSIWDNCLKSESSKGLVTLLSEAMANKTDLYLVYKEGVLRKAKQDEQVKIKADYEKSAQSSVGVYISFQHYRRTDMVKFYSAVEYATIASLFKMQNLSKAIQLKMFDMRSSTGVIDSADVKAQAMVVAKALGLGKDVLIDAQDIIELAKSDMTATSAAMEMISQKRSFYLGMPASYITGQAPKGLGDSGLGDARSVERGLKAYYFSIIKPVLEALFAATTTFESEDIDQILSSLEALKTFDITSDELISQENKLSIINKLFGLPADAEGDPPDPMAQALGPDGKPIQPGVTNAKGFAAKTQAPPKEA